MNPSKVDRSNLRQLTDLPNIGPACAKDLQRLGLNTPEDVRGQDPYALYRRLNHITGQRHDPCMLDVLISITRFMAGEPPQAWWAYTEERKRRWTEPMANSQDGPPVEL